MPSDTFKYIPANMLPAPGTCCLCTSSLRGCIDFGINLDYFGAVLFCTDCVIEITNVDELGLMRRKDAEEAMIENALLNNRDEALNTELKVVRNGMVAILDHFADVLRDTRSRSVDDIQDANQIDIDFYGADAS